jgi:hypothetical protein
MKVVSLSLSLSLDQRRWWEEHEYRSCLLLHWTLNSLRDVRQEYSVKDETEGDGMTRICFLSDCHDDDDNLTLDKHKSLDWQRTTKKKNLADLAYKILSLITRIKEKVALKASYTHFKHFLFRWSFCISCSFVYPVVSSVHSYLPSLAMKVTRRFLLVSIWQVMLLMLFCRTRRPK